VLCAGCQGGGVDLSKIDVAQVAQNLNKLRPVSQADEIEMGKSMTETLLGAAPLAEDPELQRYVNTLGRWVAQQSERPDLPWHFAVNNSTAVNAAAAPGGYVIVTVGMLRVLRNESELAGVLGHEVAHVVQKHHLTALQKEGAMGLLGQGVQAASGHGRNAALVDQLVEPTKNLYTQGLSRSDEYDADRMGVVLAARAGYQPWGLPSALQTLSSIQPDDKSVALLFKTHPNPSDRLQKLGVAMGTSFEDVPGQTNDERFQSMTARVRTVGSK
jgi:predicted Zn-dependent protease